MPCILTAEMQHDSGRLMAPLQLHGISSQLVCAVWGAISYLPSMQVQPQIVCRCFCVCTARIVPRMTLWNVSVVVRMCWQTVPLYSEVRCAGELKKASIPFTPAVGAIFMWVDLRGALPQPTWEVTLAIASLCRTAAQRSDADGLNAHAHQCELGLEYS